MAAALAPAAAWDQVAAHPVVLVGQTPVVSSGGIANLTAGQQTGIMPGTLIATMDGRRWVYSGEGSKTAEASYIEQGDVTPVWSVIADKPPFFPSNIVNVAGLQSALDGKSNTGHGHGWDDISGKPSTYPATAHTHNITDTNGLLDSLNSKANLSGANFTGTVTLPSSSMFKKEGTGNGEGGQFVMEKADQFGLGYNTIVDVNGASIRFFEGGAGYRGAYLPLDQMPSGVGARIWTSADFNPANYSTTSHSHGWDSITGKPNVAIQNTNVRLDSIFIGANDSLIYGDTRMNNFVFRTHDPSGYHYATIREDGQFTSNGNVLYNDSYPARRVASADPNVGSGGIWITDRLWIAHSGGAHYVWDSLNFNPGNYAWKGGSNVLTGLHQYRSGSGASAANFGDRVLEVYNDGNGAAMIAFHRSGQFATYFGLDTDNQLKVGGWSNGASSQPVWTGFNFDPNSKMNRLTDTWNTSSDNRNRFYYGSNGRTYYGSPDGYEWRAWDDSYVAFLDGGGNFQTKGVVTVGSGNLYLRSGSPTIYFKDTDNRSGMIHVNGNTMHFLRGAGNDSEGWETVNGRWPLTLNLENNDATFGGYVDARTNVYAGGEIYAQQSVFAGSGHWFRVRGTNCGVYWEQHGGGVYMQDNDWVRVYGGKNFYCPAQVRANTVVGESDRRLKTNIATITDATGKVEALTGVTFDWKRDGSAGMGFIAQDFEQVIPTLVTEDNDGMKGVEYGPVVALLVEALKETNARVAVLEGRV